MKNTILVLGFLFVGFIGFSQQNNEGISEILHQDEKNYEQTINNLDLKIILDANNILVTNDLETKLNFENNTHEITHKSFKVEDNIFDYKEGVYTLNEYVINYKLEFLTKTIK
ncbi:MAG: hypothetical protein ABFR32_07780 [Bacteroidota bacterium]